MNNNTAALYDFFHKRFPGKSEDVFIVLSEARLDGLGIDEKIGTLSLQSMEMLKKDFSGFSSEGIDEWYLGVLRGGQSEEEYSKLLNFLKFT